MKHCPFQSLFLSLSLSLSLHLPVWPDLAKIDHFEKNLKVLGIFWGLNYHLPKLPKTLLWQKFMLLGKFSAFKVAKCLKNYLVILLSTLILSLSLKCSLLNSILTHTRMQTNTQSRREFDEIESINGEKMFLSSTITLIFEAWIPY